MSHDHAGDAHKRPWLMVFTILLLSALAVAVVYLMSDINRHRYRLTVVNNALTVEQGLFLPVGFHTFSPEPIDLKSAYAPIPLPLSHFNVAAEIFTDRADLDRALFSLLAGWIRDLLKNRTIADTELAVTYVHRAELLPGLSEQQRLDLRRLRADLAFGEGERLTASAKKQLALALEQFRLALELGTSYEAEAREREARLTQRITQFDQPPPIPKTLPVDKSVSPESR